MSTFIAIPKKSNAKKCCEYRLISLMCHILKIFLRIIHTRIYAKCEVAMGESQFGFKEGMGTREALLCIQVLIQNCRDVQKDVFICFIDYEKAFDTVQHDKLMNTLRDIGVEEKEIRCIQNLYWNQTARIEVNGELTDEIAISKGVRQGCILSPLLFNIYSQRIFRESIEKERIGIKVKGVIINNIRYADDTTILAGSISGLQKLLDKLTYVSELYGLKINIKKTKYMVVSRKNYHYGTLLKVNNNNVERVRSFRYLGVLINDQWDISKEIKSRVEMARDAFFKYKKVFTNHDISLKTKSRFVKCYIWSILLYAVEVWTIKTTDEKKLEAFEMWIYRRILKIPWTAHIPNQEVLRRMNLDRQLLNTVKARKIAYLGHIMRNDKYKFLQTIIKGKIEGKRARGRREISWLKNIQQWTGYSDERNLINAAKNRELLAPV